MRVLISSSSPGRAGAGLKGPLRHFDTFITDEFTNSAVVSSFTELHLILYYPSIFELARNHEKAIASDEYYQTLPT
jgi:hypothetical protein